MRNLIWITESRSLLREGHQINLLAPLDGLDRNINATLRYRA